MKLYLVPTPVGNLGDMTYRAVEVLKGADLILAEDTRTSRVVMQHYGITTPMQAYHIFNEHQTLHNIVDRLLSGMTIALVTDAGTPGISDPGFLLVREAVKNNIPVEIFTVHPGPTTTDLNGNMSLPGFHNIDTVGEKFAELINDGKSHQGEFIELYPIVEE